jgi:hypothetical protein
VRDIFSLVSDAWLVEKVDLSFAIEYEGQVNNNVEYDYYYYLLLYSYDFLFK